MKNLLIIPAVLTASLSFAQFGSEKEITSTPEGYTMQSIDMDADGKPDVVGCGKNIYWFKNLGQGQFSRKQVITLLNVPPYANKSVCADLNQDGLPEIIRYNIDYHTISVTENNGNGQFENEVIIESASNDPDILQFADLNGDGLQDFISHNISGSRLYLNQGNLAFVSSVLDISTVSMLSSFAIKDLDNDGDADLVFTNYSSPPYSILIYANDGSAAFTPMTSIPTANNLPERFITTDYDNDNDVDIFYTINGSIYLSKGNGDGTFQAQTYVQSIFTGGGDPYSFTLEDINNDGLQDILSNYGAPTSGTGDLISAAICNPNGTFATPELVVQTLWGECVFNVLDLDADGKRDIITYSQLDHEITWFKNSGTGTFSNERDISEQAKYAQIKFADLNNDTHQDLIWFARGNEENEALSAFVRLGTANGLSDSTILLSAVFGSNVGQIRVADMDNDGDKDIVYSWWPNSGNGGVGLLRSNGDDSFTFVNITNSVSFGCEYVDVGDLNADGLPDIAYLGGYGAYWGRNMGNGTFTLASITATINNSQGLAICDANNDGQNDIVFSDNNLSYVPKTGATTFGPMVVIATTPNYVDNIIPYDANNDGAVDIAISTYDGTNRLVQVRINNGTGGFGTFTNMNSGDYIREMKLVDLDGDGSSELVAAFNAGNFGYAEMSGTTFTDFVTVPNQVAETIQSFDFANLDTDNYPDLAFGDGFSIYSKKNMINTFVTGKLFVDSNQNGIFDPTETAIPYSPVNTLPDENTFYTNSQGAFSIFDFANGTTIVEAGEIPFFELITDSAQYHIASVDSIIHCDFGFFPTIDTTAMDGSLTGGQPRCNEYTDLWIDFSNYGTTNPSGIIAVELDEIVSFVSASVTPDSINGQYYYWHFDELDLFGHEQFHVTLQMPDFTFSGDTMTSSLTITVPGQNGQPDQVYTDTLHQTLVCAYDPNDKTVNLTGIGTEGYIPLGTAELEYTVRFQNTGNAYAADVRITDQLSTLLDWSSLEFLASSSPAEITVNSDGLATFLFSGINLPDATTDEMGSHGFIRYRIRINENAEESDEILNTANIYFDFNPAVVTNTTLNTLFTCPEMTIDSLTTAACEGEEITGAGTNGETGSLIWSVQNETEQTATTFVWYPENAGNYLLHVSTLASVTCPAMEESFNIEVHPVYDSIWQSAISVCTGESATIFGQQQTQPGIYYAYLQTIHGCDSTLMQELIVLANPLVTLDEFAEDTICTINGSVVLPAATPAGGVFSGNGVNNGQFDPLSAGPGTHTIAYVYEDPNGCSNADQVAITVEDCLNTEDLTWNDLAIYPNPSAGKLIIRSSSLPGSVLTLTNATGKQVMASTAVNDIVWEADLSGLAAGVYFLHIANGDALTVVKQISKL